MSDALLVSGTRVALDGVENVSQIAHFLTPVQSGGQMSENSVGGAPAGRLGESGC